MKKKQRDASTCANPPHKTPRLPLITSRGGDIEVEEEGAAEVEAAPQGRDLLMTLILQDLPTLTLFLLRLPRHTTHHPVYSHPKISHRHRIHLRSNPAATIVDIRDTMPEIAHIPHSNNRPLSLIWIGRINNIDGALRRISRPLCITLSIGKMPP